MHISDDSLTKFKGSLNINLIGIKSVLNKVDLYGDVGYAKLQVDIPPHKLHLSNGNYNIIRKSIMCVSNNKANLKKNRSMIYNNMQLGILLKLILFCLRTMML